MCSSLAAGSARNVIFGVVTVFFTSKSHHVCSYGNPHVTLSYSEYFKLCIDSSLQGCFSELAGDAWRSWLLQRVSFAFSRGALKARGMEITEQTSWSGACL